MEFNEFREKVKEALPDFLTDNLRNAEIKDTAVNKLQGESYLGISSIWKTPFWIIRREASLLL